MTGVKNFCFKVSIHKYFLNNCARALRRSTCRRAEYLPSEAPAFATCIKDHLEHILTIAYYYSSWQDEFKYFNFPNQEMKLI